MGIANTSDLDELAAKKERYQSATEFAGIALTFLRFYQADGYRYRVTELERHYDHSQCIHRSPRLDGYSMDLVAWLTRSRPHNLKSLARCSSGKFNGVL
jgi:hypothetical protein